MTETTQIFILGDNIQELRKFPDNHFDSVVTDAPYGLGKEPDALILLASWVKNGYMEVKGAGFMGKKWDAFVPQPTFWKEVFRVLKPGGHVLCFFGTRTYDWGVMAMRLAGFQIRDQIQWLYGSGFPKSMNIGKAIKKWAGTEQDTEETIQFDGWGTALKPANEPIVLARKPLEKGLTIVENVLKWGTGALNIDAARIPFTADEDQKSAVFGRGTNILGGNFVGARHGDGRTNIPPDAKGRFPANVILDEQAASVLDDQTGELVSGVPMGQKTGNNNNVYGQYGSVPVTGYGDRGGASRFFYVAKPSPAEKNAGLECFERTEGGIKSNTSGQHMPHQNPDFKGKMVANTHPTVKPITLMRYMVNLITPIGGICLDPFCGSGTTGIGCRLDNINFVGIDDALSAINIARGRIEAYRWERPVVDNQLELFE